MTDSSLDSDTIARAVAGDTEALEGLLRAVEAELRAGLSINKIWRRSLEADDVMQVSFLEVFLRISSLREVTPAGFRAWIHRIVQTNTIDAIRALERDKRPDPRQRVTQGPQGDSARTLLLSVAGEHPTAGGQVSTQEELQRLQQCIARLPSSYRQVVEQVDLADRSVADVATDLGRSTGAVHMLRRRAHDRLAELLEKQG